MSKRPLRYEPSNDILEQFVPRPNEIRSPTTAELESIDHLMVNLAKIFETLLKHSKVLAEGAITDESTRDMPRQAAILVQKPRVQLARALVQSYLKSKLPLITQIINTRSVNPNNTYLVDSVDRFALSRSSEEGLHLSPVIGDRLDQSAPEPKRQATAETPASDMWPPQLPVIYNRDVQNQVFTHRSAVNNIENLPRMEALARHNERLEFKGDLVIDFIIGDELYRRYPEADEGVLSQRKSELVCNDTLWEFAKIYDLHSKARAAPGVIHLHKHDGKKMKVVADLFEAYVGGLEIDRGIDVVRAWLVRLYEPLLRELTQSDQPEVDKTAKTELYRQIGSADQPISYVTVRKGDDRTTFKVNCTVGGEVLGSGVGKNLKEASLRAAMDALKRPDRVEVYAEKRRQIPRTAPVTGVTNQDPEPEAEPALTDTVPETYSSELELNKLAPAELYSLIGSKEQPINYAKLEPSNDGAIQRVRLEVNGEILGHGEGKNLKVAKTIAAMEALKNTDRIKHYAQKRQERIVATSAPAASPTFPFE